jgi:omega-amidase
VQRNKPLPAAIFRAACIQFEIVFGDIDANLRQTETALMRAAEEGVRLAVLPEMWSCGYDYRHLPQCAGRTPEVLRHLQDLSAARQLVIVGSLPEACDAVIYNTAYVIDNGELRGSYRKLHLFSPMGEDQYLAAGDRTVVLETSLGRIGLAICYDLRFPELFRRLALAGAELICLPAEWPHPRQEHWRTLVRARAIENQVFVVAANCCGRQGRLEFFGGSLIVAPRGEVLVEADDAPGEALADIRPAEVAEYRAQIPALQHRRPDIYGDLQPQ